ncbi:MAG: alpha/beta fold hydrolase [Hoeflea sp.]|uniref:alpha/beta hydrolase family protein n=1 Tax=Hoeflea sp. TaxID=1940281 RepID=UPI001DB61705|nr:alpha/beta fold hydrolase [Hoeflea sp.]MBU4530471.1 alpha/beta fold hydrolase [Alphaproteobacteria bacterium]MBU4545258.1 alpha/beta fold hydrolase [Alphaproteobacteria bacterium]MBU4548907.1 alpha/beta fold hydrolase [Alphaproteobacteria bacterium]MBV1722062.1 alpha/beta fold hydrolase [Hoeflea sp.]MBV1761412.1 alpha/beta fold hydrolase [Hoeflea sp.]
MNNLIKDAARIPVNAPVQTLSINPVTLAAEGRGLPLEMRITAPATGTDLPIILLSHGHGPSLYIPSKDGYAPLASFYAAHGFAVIQPTHLNSRVAGLAADAPGGPLFWRARVQDMKTIIDRLDEIEAMTPQLTGRLDHGRIAAVGHSMGGQTVAMLLGARLTDIKDPDARDVNLIEPRIKAGVLLAAPGHGGDSLSEFARETYTALNPDFSHMTTPTLVVVGDADVNPHLTTRGADWHVDPYTHGPGATALLTLLGGKHGMGGISGYDAKETDDEDPERLAVTQRMSWAYLRSALYAGDPAWAEACRALEQHADAHARVDSK